MTPKRDRWLYAVLTTIAAAAVYVLIAWALGEPLDLNIGHAIALVIVFIAAYFWAPAFPRAKR